MVTGYEAGAYRDLSRIAAALSRIADALEAANTAAAQPPVAWQNIGSATPADTVDR